MKDMLSLMGLTAILTRHVYSVPTFPPCHTSHAWLTPSPFSSTTTPLSSLTTLFPTHSPFQTFLLVGIPALLSQPVPHSPVNKVSAPASMSHLRTAQRFRFSGGVRSHTTITVLRDSPVPSHSGNSIKLSGLATGPVTYDLQLDGVKNSSISPSPSGTTLLAAYDDLTPTNHTLSLIVHNPTNSSSAFMAIEYALISVNSTSPKCVPPDLPRALRVLRMLISPVQRLIFQHHHSRYLTAIRGPVVLRE
jgi:hypothetical protein